MNWVLGDVLIFCKDGHEIAGLTPRKALNCIQEMEADNFDSLAVSVVEDRIIHSASLEPLDYDDIIFNDYDDAINYLEEIL